MAEVKTKQTDADVYDFIDTFTATEQRRTDSLELVKLMQEFSGYQPKMWGPSIIGFGKYHFKSGKSSQQGDWPLVAFSPRKAALTLYVHTGAPEHEYLLKNLGKFTKSKGCIYVKKLSDLNITALKDLVTESIRYTRQKYGMELSA